MLGRIELQGAEGLVSFKPSPVTVVVGPNNVGKSTLLREIEDWFRENRNGHFLRDLLLHVDQDQFAHTEAITQPMARLTLETYQDKILGAIQALRSLGGHKDATELAELAASLLTTVEVQLAEAGSAREGSNGETPVVGEDADPPSEDETLDESQSALDGDDEEEEAGQPAPGSQRHETLVEVLAAPVFVELPEVLHGVGEQMLSLAKIALRQTAWKVLGERRSDAVEIIRNIRNSLEHFVSGEQANVKPTEGEQNAFAERAQATADSRLAQTLARTMALSGMLDLSREYSAARELVRRLDGKTRLSLLTSDSFLQYCLDFPDVFDRLRALALRTFDIHIGIDATGGVEDRKPIRLVVAGAPTKPYELRLDNEARAFFRGCPDLKNQSDGVLSYLALAVAALVTPSGLLLVDEPEAFLHPPLAARIGRIMAEVASETQATAVFATHSPHFMVGLIESAPSVNVLRIDFARRRGRRLSLLNADKIRHLALDPFFRSARMLELLFCESAILCEADSDSLFYRNTYSRVFPDSQQPSFSHLSTAHNIPRALRPLREVGLKVATIIDFDVLMAKTLFADILKAAGISLTQRQSLAALRAGVQAHFLAKTKNDLARAKELAKSNGLRVLTGEARSDALKLQSDCAALGIFVVPAGELEDWQPFRHRKLKRTKGKKSQWIRSFAKHLPDQELSDELTDFLNSIHHWMFKPSVSA